MSLDSAKAAVRSLQHSLLLASSKGVSVLAGCGTEIFNSVNQQRSSYPYLWALLDTSQ